MTPQQILLVRSTWEQVAGQPESAAVLFYGRLFELDPALRSLFRGDMTEQGRKLMTIIGMAVGGLGRLESLVPAIEDLGRRHAGYGVKDRDYDTVGAALLWTLATGLSDAFTPEAQDAWATVYGVLAETMKGAVRAGVA
ncbi:MAG: globin family protein [Gammaproteobacteria bacterium]